MMLCSVTNGVPWPPGCRRTPPSLLCSPSWHGWRRKKKNPQLGLLTQNPQSCIHNFWFACFAHPSTQPSCLPPLMRLLAYPSSSSHYCCLFKSSTTQQERPMRLIEPILVSWYKPSVGWVFESTPNTLLVSTRVYRYLTVGF